MADEKNNNNGNSNIFRQKSLDRVSSPEDLDKYIKTTTPSLWLLLASIVIFLVGVIVWASVGKLYTSSVSGCAITDGEINCYIKEEDYDKLIASSYIEIEETQIAIERVAGPIEAGTNSNSLFHNSGIEAGAWYYIVSGSTDLSEGEYKAKVVFEEVSPISFVIN